MAGWIGNPYDRLKGKFKRGDRERIDYLTDEGNAGDRAIQAYTWV